MQQKTTVFELTAGQEGADFGENVGSGRAVRGGFRIGRTDLRVVPAHSALLGTADASLLGTALHLRDERGAGAVGPQFLGEEGVRERSDLCLLFCHTNTAVLHRRGGWKLNSTIAQYIRVDISIVLLLVVYRSYLLAFGRCLEFIPSCQHFLLLLQKTHPLLVLLLVQLLRKSVCYAFLSALLPQRLWIRCLLLGLG